MCVHVRSREGIAGKRRRMALFYRICAFNSSLSYERFGSIVINTRHYTNHCALMARESCVIAIFTDFVNFHTHIFRCAIKMCPKRLFVKHSANTNESYFYAIIDFIALKLKHIVIRGMSYTYYVAFFTLCIFLLTNLIHNYLRIIC